MNNREFNLLLLILLLHTLLCCTERKRKYIASETINSNQGISIDTLDLIYDGPKNFTLDYFPKAAIHAAKVKACEITQSDTSSSRVARKVQFDQSGNITRDENNFFFWWFEGTATRTYKYKYNDGRKLTMVGFPEEDSNDNDSIMTIWNYNTQGLLYSRDAYEFAKRLKPNADRHLPDAGDFEKHPTWNQQKSFRFSVAHHEVMIETFFEDRLVDNEKFQLLFDSSQRLKAVNKFRNGSLIEITDYTYEPNSIAGFIQRTMSDGTKWRFTSKAVLNGKGEQIEKIVFDDNGGEKVKMIVSYNDNGTIRTIKYNNTIQEFKYSY